MNSAVIDVNEASLKKLTLQLKCEAALNFVHLTVRTRQVEKNRHSCLCPSITCLSYISGEMCLSEASDINFLIL